MAIALTAVALIAIRLVFFQSFVIPTGSMQPTLSIGDRVVVWRLDVRRGDIKRGDIIVFDGDGVFDTPAPPVVGLAAVGRSIARAFGAPVGEHDYVKRVIGLPGDRIACCDASGHLMINGKPLVEPYLPRMTASSLLTFDVRVPAGRYFVMGDNRADSADSRAHLGDPGGGTVPFENVVGRVVMVYWPWATKHQIARVTYPNADGSTG